MRVLGCPLLSPEFIQADLHLLGRLSVPTYDIEHANAQLFVLFLRITSSQVFPQPLFWPKNVPTALYSPLS